MKEYAVLLEWQRQHTTDILSQCQVVHEKGWPETEPGPPQVNASAKDRPAVQWNQMG